ncbi:ABC transporter permease [Rahnella sp. ChDrAdgB13]|uniref:ABC transporter permease n=1 Tax=Rahnella sp. ChDrAdgB13 TaxID=1850581 RepID=UPI001AD88233|nr:ABC transporter permease [Rahnella sp. ChDrAdgB13]
MTALFRRRATGGFLSTPDSHATLAELWQFRFLVGQLVRRDLTVRYRQTSLGWLWALVNPALHLAMYWGVFGLMVRFSPPDVTAPYPLVLLCGLVLWMLFATTVQAVSESLLNNLPLVKKVWFPRIALPLAAAGVGMVDFVLMLALLTGLCLLSGMPVELPALPLLLLSGVLTALAGWGAGCLLAIARLRFRDIRHLVPLLLQALFYATPVVWTPGLLPPRWHAVLLNPLAPQVALFRHVLLGGALPSPAALLTGLVGALLTAAAGYVCFVRYESRAMEHE